MSALPRRTIGPALRLLAVAVWLIAAAGHGIARAETAGERVVAAWAEAIRASGRHVAWSGLVADAEGDRIELADVVVTEARDGTEAQRITIPSLVLVGAAAPDGGFAVRSLTAPSVSIEGRSGSETQRVRIEGIDLSDVSVPRIDLPALDADRPFSSFWARSRVLDRIAVGRAAVQRLTATGTGSDGDSTLTIDAVSLDGLAASRVERFALGSIAIEASVAPRSARMTMDDVEVVGWDFGAWRRLWDDAAYVDDKGDGAWRPSLASARSGRISIESDGGRQTIDGVRVGARRVRQFAEPLGRVVDRLIVAPGDATRGDLARVALEVFLASDADGWSLDGLHLIGRGLDHADLRRIAVGRFSPTRLSDLTVEGLEVVGPKAILRLDRLHLGDLVPPDADDMRRAIPALTAGAEIDPSSLMPTVGRIALEGLEAAEPGVPAIRLAGLALDFGRHLRAIPTVAALRLDRFAVPAGLTDAESRRRLAALGYDTIELSGAARLAWDEARREVAVTDARASIAGAGEVTLEARLSGVPRSLFLRPDTAAETIAGIGLAEARATLTDASFLDRVVRMVAKDTGTSPDRVRRGFAAEVKALVAPIRDSARRKAAAAAVGRFLTAQKQLVVTARPKTPVPLGELPDLFDDLGALVERLDTSISSE